MILVASLQSDVELCLAHGLLFYAGALEAFLQGDLASYGVVVMQEREKMWRSEMGKRVLF